MWAFPPFYRGGIKFGTIWQSPAWAKRHLSFTIRKAKMPLILSNPHSAKASFPSSSKPKSTDAVLPSLGCVTGLEPAKHDAKWQNRPSRFCYVLPGRRRFIATDTSAIGWNYGYCCTLECLEWKRFSILASQRSADGWELHFYFLPDKLDYFCFFFPQNIHIRIYLTLSVRSGTC